MIHCGLWGLIKYADISRLMFLYLPAMVLLIFAYLVGLTVQTVVRAIILNVEWEAFS